MTPLSPSAASRAPSRPGLPLQAGAGFKAAHLDDWLGDAQAPAFFEVHAENYMGEGGAPHAWLTQLCAMRPLSLHGVGLSIGGASPPDAAHLARLATLIARYRPAAFSEHLAWSTHEGRFYNDLLPLTYDARTLDRVCAHVDAVQDRLGMRLLLENPSTYFEFAASTFDEPDFIAHVVARTGCGLLLDVNNVYVSCSNQARNARDYLAALPLHAVGEIHLAGHAVEHAAQDAAMPDPATPDPAIFDPVTRGPIAHDPAPDLADACDPRECVRAALAAPGALLIDHHGAPVAEAVWRLYAETLASTGPVATLIEWDNDVPSHARLREEARRAERLLGFAHRAARDAAA